MNTWTGPPDAWNAAFNDDGSQLVCGKGAVTWRHNLIGLVRSLAVPGRNTYQGGFGDHDTFLRATLRDPSGASDLEWVIGSTGEAEPIQILPPTSNFQAGPGRHWAASCSGVLLLDGVVIGQNAGRPLALSLHPDGRTALAVNCGDALRLYVGGVRQYDGQGRDVLPRPTDTTIDLFTFVWPWISLGYGKPYLINVETGEMVYVGAFPAHNECKAAPDGGWRIWSLGVANGQEYLCGRLANASRGQVIPVTAGTDVVARDLPGVMTLVAVNDSAALVLYEVPADYPVTDIPTDGVGLPPVDPPPPTEPAGPDPVLPPLGRHVPMGFFFRDTYTDQRIVNGAIDQKGPDCPGSLTWCVQGEARAAITADRDSLTGEPVNLVIDESCVRTMALRPERWDRVFAIYLGPEEANDPLIAMAVQRDDIRAQMHRLGVPTKPFILYNTDHPPVALADQDTILAVQLYLSGTQGPDDLRALAAQQRTLVGDLPVALICQAYGRWAGRTPDTATYTGDLAALVPVYAGILRDWLQVQAVGCFSWRRPGGTLDYPALKPWWRAFARACQ